MARLHALIPVAFLAACAAPAPAPVATAPPAPPHPTPRCTGQVECGQMWARAIQSVELATGMKVQTANETMIQTFPPARIGLMRGTVVRYPITTETNEIRLTLECRHYEDCSSQAAAGLSLFNLLTQGPPMPSPAPPAPQ